MVVLLIGLGWLVVINNKLIVQWGRLANQGFRYTGWREFNLTLSSTLLFITIMTNTNNVGLAEWALTQLSTGTFGVYRCNYGSENSSVETSWAAIGY